MASSEICTVIPGVNSRAELKENISTLERADGVDESFLELCLNRALSYEGKAILRNLANIEGVRTDIRAYASRALG
jgi:hypothetical protein